MVGVRLAEAGGGGLGSRASLTGAVVVESRSGEGSSGKKVVAEEERGELEGLSGKKVVAGEESRRGEGSSGKRWLRVEAGKEKRWL